jgi:hypothetical protein
MSGQYHIVSIVATSISAYGRVIRNWCVGFYTNEWPLISRQIVIKTISIRHWHDSLLTGPYSYLLVRVAWIYLPMQALLDLFSYYIAWKCNRSWMPVTPMYAGLCLIGLLILYIIAYLNSRYSLYSRYRVYYWTSIFIVLVICNILPSFIYKFSMVHVVWALILSTTATGTIVFQETVLHHYRPETMSAVRTHYHYLRFHLEKLMLAWLTTGTVVGITQTILWTTPRDVLAGGFVSRTYTGVYIVLAFWIMSALVVLFAGFPLYKRISRCMELLMLSKSSFQLLINEYDKR